MYELYDVAESNRIPVFHGHIPETRSMSVPGAICLDESIQMGSKEERTRLGHEVGHNMRNAFYTRSDPAFIRRRMENQADTWEIKKLIPKDELRKAYESGYTEIWQLSDYFWVEEELIRKAYCLYTHGNLALEYYFNM